MRYIVFPDISFSTSWKGPAMNWLLALEILGIAYGVWIVVCLGIFATLKDRVPKYTWHFKVYSMFCDTQPQLGCLYVRDLMLAPAKFILSFLFICIMFIWFFLFDWIIQPCIFGNRVVHWKNKHYWLGNAGEYSEYHRWRFQPEYKSFFPFARLCWLIGVPVVCIFLLANHLGLTTTALKGVEVEALLAGVVGLLVLLFFSARTSLRERFETLKSKLCKPLLPPSEFR